MIILNSALYKYEIDLRLVINGFQKPLKRFVHRDNPHNPHYTVFSKPKLRNSGL
jgi:bifunctional pyridoxal-dependent enzyme with beta-cystathionase and maltose regulon repressor activities